MLLAVDIGNSNVCIGLFDGDILLLTARLKTEHGKTADQYAVDLKNILLLHGYRHEQIEDAVISSVVPDVGKSFGNAISMLCHIVPLSLGPGVKTGLNIKIDNPAQLGADLAAGAVGAVNSYTLPCIIIDMGTATTVSVVNSSGEFLGGMIAAGVNLTLKALTNNTSQLPSISIEAPKSVIGKNTDDCMRSGLVIGTAAMLDGVIERIEKELGSTATAVATGGLSKEIIQHCNKEIIYDENLILEGLRIIYEKNN